jgi:hypothetical protein
MVAMCSGFGTAWLALVLYQMVSTAKTIRVKEVAQGASRPVPPKSWDGSTVNTSRPLASPSSYLGLRLGVPPPPPPPQPAPPCRDSDGPGRPPGASGAGASDASATGTGPVVHGALQRAGSRRRSLVALLQASRASRVQGVGGRPGTPGQGHSRGHSTGDAKGDCAASGLAPTSRLGSLCNMVSSPPLAGDAESLEGATAPRVSPHTGASSPTHFPTGAPPASPLQLPLPLPPQAGATAPASGVDFASQLGVEAGAVCVNPLFERALLGRVVVRSSGPPGRAGPRG